MKRALARLLSPLAWVAYAVLVVVACAGLCALALAYSLKDALERGAGR